MKVLISANTEQQEEMLTHDIVEPVSVVWVNSLEDVESIGDFDVVIDLQFETNHTSIPALLKFSDALVIINAVQPTLEELQQPFVRINGWNGFLRRPMMEAAAMDSLQSRAQEVFAGLGRSTEWVPDVPGLLSARVVSSIINEAYFALEEKVSTEEEIDLALKMGTNYPFGPFEWGRKIGLKKVYWLLDMLSKQEARYQPSPLLKLNALA